MWPPARSRAAERINSSSNSADIAVPPAIGVTQRDVRVSRIGETHQPSWRQLRGLVVRSLPASGILVSGDAPGSTMTPARGHRFSGSDSSSSARCSCSRMMRALWDPTPAIWLSSLVLAATMLRSVPK